MIKIFDGIFPVENAHLYRQAVATLASCLLSLTGGLTLGYSAVLLPELEKDDTYPYDKEYDSWIASITPLATVFGCLLAGNISDGIGRRKGQMYLTFPYSLGWIIIAVAQNNATMLTGRFIIGICTGAMRSLAVVYVSEASDPKYRAMALFAQSVSLYFGSLLSHVSSDYVSRRIMCFVFIIPNTLCFFLLLFLKESPLWLITVGKTAKGVESFKSFRGSGENAAKELKSVLEGVDVEIKSRLEDFIGVVCSKPFMKSMWVMFLLSVAVQFCGVNTISFYSQTLFEDTFGATIDAYVLMLVTDLVRVLAASLMCFLSERWPRKRAFLISAYGTSVILVGLVIYLYVKPNGLAWIAVTLLISYVAVASILTSLSLSFSAEIFPNKVRGFGTSLCSTLSFLLLFISVKFTPDIIDGYGEAAMYGSFAVLTLVASFGLTFVLPETNGVSLQDIENEMYHKNGSNGRIHSVKITNAHKLYSNVSFEPKHYT